MKQSPGDHWQIPWLLIAIRRFEVRRCAQWFGCHLKGPSRRTGFRSGCENQNQIATYDRFSLVDMFVDTVWA